MGSAFAQRADSRARMASRAIGSRCADQLPVAALAAPATSVYGRTESLDCVAACGNVADRSGRPGGILLGLHMLPLESVRRGFLARSGASIRSRAGVNVTMAF